MRALHRVVLARTLGCLSAVLVLVPATIRAQTIRDELFVANGPVHAIALGGTGYAGEKLYIGGSFTQVGPATGGAVPLNATTGQPLALPKVAGTVYAVTPDGSGGWYLGGDFTAVGGQERLNLAHLESDNTLSSWNPGTNGVVRALAVSGGTLYAGGDFTTIAGVTRNRIAALDGSTAIAEPWDPNSNNTIEALVVSGATVYAAGSFTHIGGQNRNRAAALLAASGAATGWNPGPNGTVRTMAVTGPVVFAGGDFTTIGGQSRDRIAAVNTVGGEALAWNPGANAPVFAVVIDGSIVYAGGDFTTIGGQGRNRLAALNASQGTVLGWDPGANGRVASLVVNGSTLLVGGSFTAVAGQTRNRLALVDAVTAALAGWNPNANAAVLTIASSGATIFAGGQFTSVGGQERNNVAALDLTDGTVTAWNPNANGTVFAISARYGSSEMFVGGEFTTIGGASRDRIAALDQQAGNAIPWLAAGTNGTVRVIESKDSQSLDVYIGGDFTTLGGVARNHLGLVSYGGGVVMPFDPNVNGPVYALAFPNYSPPYIVYVGGNFTSVGGVPRNNIAKCDGWSGGVDGGWNPNANGIVRALAYRPGGNLGSDEQVFAGGDFTNVGGQARAFIARLDVSGNVMSWNPNADGPVHVLEGDNLYVSQSVLVGGEFNHIGGQPRQHLAAVDLNGNANAWKPAANGTVRALAGGPLVSYAGGDFSSIDRRPHSNVAAIRAVHVTAHDIYVPEGDANGALFHVTLDQPLEEQLSVQYTTFDCSTSSGCAQAGIDYTPTSVTVTFEPGETDRIVPVPITHDAKAEYTETFFFRPTSFPATVTADEGQAWIVDDDGAAFVRETLVSVNGTVSALAKSENTIYVGGSFTRVGLATGAAASIDPASGQPLERLGITGNVRAVVDDGQGGWFVGGDFQHAGGLPRIHLLHILADHSIATWNPSPNGPVLALARNGATLYVGGLFSFIAGVPRSQIAAFDVASGNLTAWSPHPERADSYPPTSVSELAVSGSLVYAGGNFTSMGGLPRRYVAALDATSGTPTMWEPAPNAPVLAVVPNGASVFVGGEFTSIGGQARNRLAEIDAGTGLPTSWDSNLDGFSVKALALDGGTLYVGGSFSAFGGVTRNCLAALNASNAQITNWNPALTGGPVMAIAARSGLVYVGGQFSAIGGSPRRYLAAIGAASGLPTSWSPEPDTTVSDVAVIDGAVYAGGGFATLGGVGRYNLAAFDITTGTATAWNPGADGSVDALVASGGIVCIAGSFTHVGGQPRSKVAAVDGVTGIPTPLDLQPAGSVAALATDGTTLYMGGTFTHIGGEARFGIAAVDLATGDVTAWNPGEDACTLVPVCCDWDPWCEETCYAEQCPSVTALALSGSTLYVAGSFENMGGAARRGLAALDVSTGQATPWNPAVDGPIYSIVPTQNTVYVGGGVSWVGSARHGIAALGVVDGLPTPWAPDLLGGQVRAIASSPDGDVYAGGNVSGFQNGPRLYLAQIAPDGSIRDWTSLINGEVFSLAMDGSTLYAAGAFGSFGDLPHRGIAAVDRQVLSVAGGTGPRFEWTRMSPNPASGPVEIEFTLPEVTNVKIGVFDIQGRKIARIAEGRRSAGRHRVRWDGMVEDRKAPAGLYLIRFQAGNRSLTQRLVLIH